MSNSGKIPGGDCRVYLGASQMGGVQSFTLPGMSYANLDTTDMGDDAETFMLGIASGGEIQVSGQLKSSDAVLQAIESANQGRTFLSNLYFTLGSGPVSGVSAVSYYGPSSDGSGVYITKFSPMKADKGGMVQAEFTAKVSGRYLRQ